MVETSARSDACRPINQKPGDFRLQARLILDCLVLRGLRGKFLHAWLHARQAAFVGVLDSGLRHSQSVIVAGIPPVHLRQEQRRVDAVAILASRCSSANPAASRRGSAAQAQVDQLRVLGVVVVLFGFDARIGQVVDLDLQAHVRCRPSCTMLRQFQHGELLGELIEDAALARRGRIQAGDLDAAHRVANIEEAARLSALAVHGERMSDRRLRRRSGSARCRRPRRSRSD